MQKVLVLVMFHPATPIRQFVSIAGDEWFIRKSTPLLYGAAFWKTQGIAMY
jgi:hypothetical protein